MSDLGARTTSVQESGESIRGNKVKERPKNRDGTTVAGYKRAAVATNLFAARGDYVKSSRATIRAAIA